MTTPDTNLGGRFAFAALAALAVLSTPLTRAQTPAKADEVIKLEAFVSTGSRFNNRTVVDSPVDRKSHTSELQSH